jgi:small subunit ribosomal protein S20
MLGYWHVADGFYVIPAWLTRFKDQESSMANTKSAKKATRVSARRAAVNKNRTSRVRSSLRKVEEAIVSGNKEAAVVAMKVAEPELMRGAQKGILHKNTASRKISRLTSRIRALFA